MEDYREKLHRLDSIPPIKETKQNLIPINPVDTQMDPSDKLGKK